MKRVKKPSDERLVSLQSNFNRLYLFPTPYKTNSNIVCSCMLCFEFVDLMRAFRRFAEVFPSVDRKHHAAP